MVTRIVGISDTHNQHDKIELPEGEILVHCGDFTNTGSYPEILSFANWFAEQSHPTKLLVFGNHDISTDPVFYDSKWQLFHSKKVELPKGFWTKRGITVLSGNSVTVRGLKFWGHPALPSDQKDWAWSSPSFLESHRLWETVPSDVDVILTHSPPYGTLDLSCTGENIGNEEMAVCLEDRIRPRPCIFGHVHSPGTVKNTHGTSSNNVAMCEDDRSGPKLAFKPTLIYLV